MFGVAGFSAALVRRQYACRAAAFRASPSIRVRNSFGRAYGLLTVI